MSKWKLAVVVAVAAQWCWWWWWWGRLAENTSTPLCYNTVPVEPWRVEPWSSDPDWRRRLTAARVPVLVSGAPTRHWLCLEHLTLARLRDSLPAVSVKRQQVGVVVLISTMVWWANGSLQAPGFFYHIKEAPLSQAEGPDYTEEIVSAPAFFALLQDPGQEHIYASGPIEDVIPPELRCDAQTGRTLALEGVHDVDINVWMAGTNTTARMHFDVSHNMYVPSVGSKTFLLLPPAAHGLLRFV
jgi:hypothetical protein